jgi:hypothetical protein
MVMTIRKRPFVVFYGESTRTQVAEHNYHVRSRAASVITAIRAALTRMHMVEDCSRVDVYDIDMFHVATIVHRGNGFEVKFTPWMVKQHFEEVRKAKKGGIGFTGIY